MKNKKIWLALIIAILLLLIGTVNVNAETEVYSINQLVELLGSENVTVEGDIIKLQNDITLANGISINDGNYIIDLNGKEITYVYQAYKAETKIEGNKGTTSIIPSGMPTAVITVNGGNVILRDSQENGTISTNNYVIEVYHGNVIIENGLYYGSIRAGEEGKLTIHNATFCRTYDNVYIESSQNGIIQIDGGKFINCKISSAKNMIINDGIFYGQIVIDVIPYTTTPTIQINGGNFICDYDAAFIAYYENLLENTTINGGTFITLRDDAGAITVHSQNGEGYDLKNLLAKGVKLSNNEQKIDVYSYSDGSEERNLYKTASAKRVSVIGENEIEETFNFVCFLNENNKVYEVQKCSENQSAILPKAPYKEGYVFVGWDKELTNINEDMMVSPIFEKILKLDVKDITKQKYTGTAITPSAEIFDIETKQTLQQGRDYEITYSNNINVGIAKVAVKGIGNYKYADTINKEFEILSKDFNSDNIEINKLDNENYVYNGQVITPKIEVKCDNIKLIEGVDYQVTGNNVKAGSANLDIKGIGNYQGWTFYHYNIEPKKLSDENVSVDTSDKIYTGSEVKPEVVVKDGSKILTKSKDYLIYYQNNYTVGTATIKIVGYGNYTGEIAKTFNIIKREKDINQISTINIDTADKLYTGNLVKTNIDLKDGTISLVEGKDYTVIYSDARNEGVTTVKITGKGNYKGEIVRTFNIIKIDINKITSNIDLEDKLYTGNSIEPKVELKDGSKILEKGKDYDVFYNNNIVEGKATIRVTGKGVYKGEFTKSFNIVRKDISKLSTITVDTSNKQYTGSSITTTISLRDENYTLINGKDYEVKYTNNKDCGIATVAISGKGIYKGVITKTFKIIPRKISITSLKNTILRCVTIKWNKNSAASGYEIYRATSINGNYTNVKTISRNSTTSHTFVAQAKGTYYYKIRSYVIVNGTKIYSDFSEIQSVKVTR